ncbi:hypothetical protein, partial [Pseudomonas viridiflava]|uniref:hypothetical protein n=1 Tax=Pseudomonas viridiflava TaxID=33069 RepID=UPI00197EEE84
FSILIIAGPSSGRRDDLTIASFFRSARFAVICGKGFSPGSKIKIKDSSSPADIPPRGCLTVPIRVPEAPSKKTAPFPKLTGVF